MVHIIVEPALLKILVKRQKCLFTVKKISKIKIGKIFKCSLGGSDTIHYCVCKHVGLLTRWPLHLL